MPTEVDPTAPDAFAAALVAEATRIESMREEEILRKIARNRIADPADDEAAALAALMRKQGSVPVVPHTPQLSRQSSRRSDKRLDSRLDSRGGQISRLGSRSEKSRSGPKGSHNAQRAQRAQRLPAPVPTDHR